MQYILVNGKPVHEPDLIKWGEWMSKRLNQVALDEINGCRVSTVFLGLDHSFGGKEPVLWETMILGGEHDMEQQRYTSVQDALAGHREMCNRIATIVCEYCDGRNKIQPNCNHCGAPL